MKTLFTLITLLFLNQAYSYDLSNKFGIGASYGYPIPVFGNNFNDVADAEWSGSLYARFHLTSSLGVDLGVSKEAFKSTPMYFKNINLLAFWRTDGAANMSPIVGLGVGLTKIKEFTPNSSKLSLLARLGFEYGFTPALSMSAFADYQYVSKILGDMPLGADHVINPQIALTWYFGGDNVEKIKEEKPVEKKADVVSSGQSSTMRSGPAMTIEFDTDSANIKEVYLNDLKNVADEITDTDDVVGLVEGHADSTGTNEHNDRLSKRRAEAVKKKLIEYGVDEKQIEVESYGEDRPIADNNTSEGRQRNRRATVTITITNSLNNPM